MDWLPIVNQLPCSVYIVDAQHRFTFLNNSCAALFGLSAPERAIGKTYTDFFSNSFSERSMQEDLRIINSGEPILNNETCMERSTGKQQWIAISKSPHLDEKGKIVGVLGTLQDIQPKIELERYRLAVENAGIGLWNRNLETETEDTWFSTHWKSLLGYKEVELENTYDQWRELVHPDDVARIELEIDKATSSPEEIYECEYQMRHKEGHYRWIRSNGKTSQNRQGQLVFAGSHIDITQAKNFYLHILDTAPNLIFIKDKDFKFTFVNQAIANIFGYPKKYIIGKTDFDINPDKEQCNHFRKDDQKVLDTGKELNISEETLRSHDGTPRFLVTKKVPLLPTSESPEKDIQVLGVSTDITEYKERLKHERDLLNLLMDNVPDEIFFKDREHRFVLVNRAMARLVGARSPEDMFGEKNTYFGDRAYSEQAYEEEERIFRTGKPELNIMRRTPIGPCKYRWSLVNKVPIKNNKHEVQQIIGLSKDITVLKNTQFELMKSVEMLEEIFKEIPSYIFIKDRNYKYIKCNERFAKRHGYLFATNIVGKSDYDLWSKKEADRYRKDDEEVMNKNVPKLHYREEQNLPGEKTRILETSKIPLHDEEDNVIALLGIYEDITDRLKEERHKYHIDIARSIGHCLKGWTKVLNWRCMGLEELLKDNGIVDISGIVDGLKKSIAQLNTAARIGTNLASLESIKTFEEFPLNSIVMEVVDSFPDKRTQYIPIKKNLCVKGSKFHLSNAFLELLENASRHIPLTKPNGLIKISIDCMEDRCTIHVRDNGEGVPEHLVNSLFDMYAGGSATSTGMGLAYVKEVAKIHNGDVALIERANPGAHFGITLPIFRTEGEK